VPRLASLIPILAPLALLACPRTSGPPPVQVIHGSSAALGAERATEGTIQDRLVSDDADLVIFYGSEQKGSLEPCGCPKEPRGSVPRLAAYLDASTAANPDTPWLLLNAGYFLEDAIGLGGELRADVPLSNRWMVRGLEEGGRWTALNVGYVDLPGIVDLAQRQELPSLPLVSANVQAREGAPPVAPWIAVPAGELTVGVTGITNPGVSFVPTPQYTVSPPEPALEAALEEMRGQVDLVVLLAFQAIDEARSLARKHPEIGVVVDAYGHHESVPPFVVGEAIWVKSHHQTQRLGELRLWIEDGAIVRVVDRKVELDPDIPGDPELTDIMVRAHQEIEAKAKEIWGR
jgi:hypothetical protein